MDRFLDSRTSPEHRAFATDFMAQDAFESGMIAVLAAGLCLAARLGSIERSRAAWALSGLVAADLLRAGAGLNPSVPPSAYNLSPEVARVADVIREEGRRYFTCNVEASNRYWQARQLNDARHEAWILGVLQDTLTPATNSPHGVRNALSRDNTGTVAPSRSLPVDLLSCRRLDALVPRLQAAGVSRLVAIDPMEHPDLRVVEELAPARLAPLRIFVYEVAGFRPRFSAPVEVTRDIPGHLVFSTNATTSVELDLLEPVAKGWSATLNGAELVIQEGVDGHQRMTLPAGRNEVRLDYRLPGLVPGLILSSLSVLVCLALFVFSGPTPKRTLDVLTNRPPGSESLS